jgi:TATA-box binding protein (TBP) (component of TFIID and TFIIIB)
MEVNYPTPYRISTITATGCIGTNINLDLLYDVLAIESEVNSKLIYIEYGKKKSERIFKGESKKLTISCRKSKPIKRFDNQVTVVYHMDNGNKLNIKTFRNGNIQMTGIKEIDNGHTAVDLIIDIVKKLYVQGLVNDINSLINSNFRIRLINTDYKIGFPIKREFLHKLLKLEYGLVCNYEPVIYPGVKVHYFYNKIHASNDGICRCQHNCGERKGGDGNGLGDCKKITIAIFQSGCIIITGSQTKDQIEECYKYTNEVLYNNREQIEKITMLPPNLTVS